MKSPEPCQITGNTTPTKEGYRIKELALINAREFASGLDVRDGESCSAVVSH